MDLENDLVEAYFESNGFLVRQVVSTDSLSVRKRYVPLQTMAIFNPIVVNNANSLGFRLYTSDLRNIRSGIVSLLGWGNSEFANGMLNNDAMLVKYFKKELKDNRIESSFSENPTNSQIGMGSFLRLLIVPALPRSESKISEVFSMLQKIQVDGVLTLRSILENLLKQSDSVNSKLGKPFFQLINLLKAYELAREPQLEMF
jgi:hypothetical protein